MSPLCRRSLFLCLLLGACPLAFAAPAVPSAPIVVSVTPLALLVAEIDGDNPPPALLPSASRSAHHPLYRPADRLLAARARPLFWLGARLEPGLGQLLDALGDADAVALVRPADAAAGEHPWLDLAAVRHMATDIATALAQRNPDSGDRYRHRVARLDRRLSALVAHYRARFAALPARDYVAEHDAFSALDRPFDLTLLGAVIQADGDRSGTRSLWRLQAALAQRPAICLLKLPGSNLSLARAIGYHGRVITAVVDPLGRDIAVTGDGFVRFVDQVLGKIYRCVAAASPDRAK